MTSEHDTAARDLTSDGTRFYIDGHPASAPAAHRVLIEDHAMDDYVERVGLLDSIKEWPEADTHGARIPYGPQATG